MTYRVAKAEPLTCLEIEINWLECLDTVTPTPEITGNTITNYDPTKVYWSDGDVIIASDGTFTGNGRIFAFQEGKNMSFRVVV